MLKVEETGQYDHMLEDLLFEYPSLESVVEKIVILFKKNPEDTRLDNHPLTKRMIEKWAFSITDDIRIVYEWLGKTTVRFLAIGGHQRAYRRKKNID